MSATITYRLKCIGDHKDLDGYLFGDEDHAIEWLLQDYIRGSWPSYLIEKVKVREAVCKYCGSSHQDIEVLKTYKVEDFLPKEEICAKHKAN